MPIIYMRERTGHVYKLESFKKENVRLPKVGDVISIEGDDNKVILKFRVLRTLVDSAGNPETDIIACDVERVKNDNLSVQ